MIFSFSSLLVETPGERTHAPLRLGSAAASSSSVDGPMTALASTGPFVPGVQAIVAKVNSVSSGAIMRPVDGLRLNPTGNVPHCSSRQFLSPQLSKVCLVHEHARVSLSDDVRRGPI